MTMKKPGTSQQRRDSDPYKTHMLQNVKVPKMSQKVIDFDNMSSFDSEQDRSKNRSYIDNEEADRETQDILHRKCNLSVTKLS